MLKKNLLAVTTLSSLLFTAFAWAAESSPLATVEVQTSGQSAGRVVLDAVVEAVRQTTLSAQVPGAITSLGVKAGDVVKAGEVVGWVGMTGNTSGPHCHFEVRIKDQPTNPERFFWPDGDVVTRINH